MDSRPRYMISVAADLVGMHPQTLRLYETKGLVRPARTPGGTRLYSDQDVERLRLIQRLTTELRLNLAGVEHVLRLQDELNRVHGVAKPQREGACQDDAGDHQRHLHRRQQLQARRSGQSVPRADLSRPRAAERARSRPEGSRPSPLWP